MAKKEAITDTVEIREISTQQFQAYLVGTSPILLNRLAEKARHELLLPRGKKSTAEKAANLKHDPVAEYRASPYRMREENAPTLLAVPAGAVKGSLRDAALNVEGAKKAEIGRLTWVEGDLLPLYGVPKLHMGIVRSADMNKTPDIRTRAIIERWAVPVNISFVAPNLNHTSIANLLSAAGLTIGIGDWRQAKGSGSFGQFRVTNAADKELREILKFGRDSQVAAMESPEPYDAEAEELLAYFDVELKRRGIKVAAA